jgi:hypothetical protein
VANKEFNLEWVAAARAKIPTLLPECGIGASPIPRSGTLRTLAFAVGVVLALFSTAYAQPGVDDQRVAHTPGLLLALDQWSMVAGHRRQPTAVEIDRLIRDRGTAPNAPRSRDEDRAVQQLYGEIMRQTDPTFRP